MPAILTTGAVMICAHGGQVHAVAPNPRVKVMGQPVLTQVAPLVVTGCAQLPPPVAIGPCLTALWITGSLRVKVMGQPVVTQASQSICVPAGTPATIVTTGLRVTVQ